MSDLIFTHVYERARRKMGLTRDEYALVNYVHTWAGYPGNARPGWCDRTLEQKADFIGITPRGITKMQNRLIESNLVEKDPLTAHVRATKVWFENIHEAKAEEAKAFLLKEQSSQVDQEQSSQNGRNKVPRKKEQSSQNGRNKVPTHIKGSLFNSIEEDREDIIAETETPSEIVIGFLNKLTRSSFRANTDATVKAINGRLSEKFTIDDILLVVEFKVAEWLNDPKMSNYLQPSTLFRPANFENYFQAATKWQTAGKPNISKNGKFPSDSDNRFGVDIKNSTSGAFS